MKAQAISPAIDTDLREPKEGQHGDGRHANAALTEGQGLFENRPRHHY
jgi:hypothetical protein